MRIPAEIEVGYLPQAILDFGGHTIDDFIYEAQGDLREIEGRLRYLEKEMSQAEEDELEAILVEYSERSEKFLILTDSPPRFPPRGREAQYCAKCGGRDSNADLLRAVNLGGHDYGFRSLCPSGKKLF